MAQGVHIGNAAESAGITVDTVRFYQKLGLIKSSPRSAGGYRIFDDEHIHELKFIRHAQELGFSLGEIKELLALRRRHHVCPEVHSMLQRKVAQVQRKIQSLLHLKRDLNSALRVCERELRLKRSVKHEDCCPVLDKLERANGRSHVAHANKSKKQSRV